jgi:hypothetical protein
MSTLDATRAELGLLVLYLNKAEARDKICRAIQYGSKFLSNGEPGKAQNVDKTTSLARKVFRLFKVRLIFSFFLKYARPFILFFVCPFWYTLYNEISSMIDLFKEDEICCMLNILCSDLTSKGHKYKRINLRKSNT